MDATIKIKDLAYDRPEVLMEFLARCGEYTIEIAVKN